MENWNVDHMNEVFIKRANYRNPERYLNKPKHEAFDELMQVELALRDINWRCAQHCRQKTMLITFLDSIPSLTFSNKPAAYVNTYIGEANSIKTLILSDKLF